MADEDDKPPAGRADAVRNAAAQAFEATAGQAATTRERAQELADELARAAGRVIGAIDELRPATADDIRSLREDVRALEGRVAALEAAPAEPKPKSKKPKPKKHKPRAPGSST
jgi:polyhydroxyalkanoate synthesis regulator phasin